MRRFIAGALALGLAACTTPHHPYRTDCAESLVIRQHRSMKELGRYPLEKDGRFELAFIHSVSKTPVIDSYRTRSGKIIQTKETFEDHGAGLPSLLDEPGEIRWEQGGGKFILHLNRPVEPLVVRTDADYHNTLILGDQVVDLNQWEDQALLMTIEPCHSE